MNLDLLALGVSTAAVVALAALLGAAVQIAARRRDELVERIAAPPAAQDDDRAPWSQGAAGGPSGPVARLVGAAARLAQPGRPEERHRLRARLYLAGIRGESAASTFLASKLASGVAALGAALGWDAVAVEDAPSALLLAVVAFAGGYHLPDGVIASRARQRQAAVERGLADALDLLVTCVEAGLGLDGALRRVAGELRLAHPLLGEELATTFLEVKAGIPRVEAFRRLAERTGVDELKSLAGTLAQTETFGTGVALALRAQAEGIRTRRMHRAEERAGFVAVKMTVPLTLCILPALLTIIVGPSLVRAGKTLPSITRTK